MKNELLLTWKCWNSVIILFIQSLTQAVSKSINTSFKVVFLQIHIIWTNILVGMIKIFTYRGILHLRKINHSCQDKGRNCQTYIKSIFDMQVQKSQLVKWVYQDDDAEWFVIISAVCLASRKETESCFLSNSPRRQWLLEVIWPRQDGPPGPICVCKWRWSAQHQHTHTHTHTHTLPQCGNNPKWKAGWEKTDSAWAALDVSHTGSRCRSVGVGGGACSSQSGEVSYIKAGWNYRKWCQSTSEGPGSWW